MKHQTAEIGKVLHDFGFLLIVDKVDFRVGKSALCGRFHNRGFHSADKTFLKVYDLGKITDGMSEIIADVVSLHWVALPWGKYDKFRKAVVEITDGLAGAEFFP